MDTKNLIEKLEKNYRTIVFSAAGIIVLATIAGIIIINRQPQYVFATAKRANIADSISTTGTVKSSQDLSLSFKKGGSVATVKVAVGDKVSKGETLLALDGKNELAVISQAQASLDAAEASYKKLQNGATQSQIEVASSAVDAAETALKNANDIAEKNMGAQYSNASSLLSDSYIKMYNAYSAVDAIERNYFTGNDQEGLSVRYNQEYGIKQPKDSAEKAIDKAAESGSEDDADAAISQTGASLDKMLKALAEIRDTCDSTNYQSKISAADRAALDAQKASISSAKTSLAQLQNSIIVLKTQNDNSIKSAEAALAQAKASLALANSPTRQEDLDASLAQVEAAKASLQSARNSYADTVVSSPIDGIVTAVNPKIGEVVSAGSPAIAIISQGKFQVEAYVSETDLGKISVGKTASITLDAYGHDNPFSASVISVDPAATATNGIPTYKITLEFNDESDLIKPGMTANIKIIGEQKTNALVVPASSIIARDGEYFVLTSDADGKITEKRIVKGLEGSQGYSEIVSGLNEGDKVATFGK